MTLLETKQSNKIMTQENKKKFIFICFCVLITSILSPFASNEYVRNETNSDLIAAIGTVVQSKMALDEGQFPPRTAPWQHNNYGNPWFQFYSPVCYTTAGLIYKWFTPKNPFLALKIMLWLSLLMGTIFFNRLIFWFTNSHIISFLSASTYIMSPYLLINIFGRNAIAEALAQGLLPIVLYFSLKIYFSKKINLMHMIFSSFAWFVLLGTHLITFTYLSLFLGLFLLLFSITNKLSFKPIMLIGFTYLYALLIGFYYLVPIALYSKYLSITSLGMMPVFQFLTPFFTLLSITPTSPIPLPGNGILSPVMKLYVSLGLPILLAIGNIIYILFIKKIERLNDTLHSCAAILLVLFFIAFFAAWTPFNFWPHLPEILQIGQFSYRFLAQTMWMGTILFALALFALTQNTLSLKHAVIGFILIAFCTRPWIFSQHEGGSIPVQDIVKNPDFGYGRDGYLIAANAIQMIQDPITLSQVDTIPFCTREGKKTICNITTSQETNNIIQLPVFYYPNMLNIKVNGIEIHYFPTQSYNSVLVGLKLPRGAYKIESYFQGIHWANWVSIVAIGLIIVFTIFVQIIAFVPLLCRSLLVACVPPRA